MNPAPIRREHRERFFSGMSLQDFIPPAFQEDSRDLRSGRLIFDHENRFGGIRAGREFAENRAQLLKNGARGIGLKPWTSGFGLYPNNAGISQVSHVLAQAGG